MKRSKKQKAGIKEEDLTEFDILCGKSRFCVNHSGSRRFRAYLEAHKERYAEAQTKFAKILIIKEIYHSLTPTCRFVKFNRQRNLWEEINSTDARDKIGHALRFANTRTNDQAGPTTAQSPVPTEATVPIFPRTGHPTIGPTIGASSVTTPYSALLQLHNPQGGSAQVSVWTHPPQSLHQGPSVASPPALLQGHIEYVGNTQTVERESGLTHLSGSEPKNLQLQLNQPASQSVAKANTDTLTKSIASAGEPSTKDSATSTQQDHDDDGCKLLSSSVSAFPTGSIVPSAASLPRAEGQQMTLPSIAIDSLRDNNLYLGDDDQSRGGIDDLGNLDTSFASFSVGAGGVMDSTQVRYKSSCQSKQAIESKNTSEASFQLADTKPRAKGSDAESKHMVGYPALPSSPQLPSALAPGQNVSEMESHSHPQQDSSTESEEDHDAIGRAAPSTGTGFVSQHKAEAESMDDRARAQSSSSMSPGDLNKLMKEPFLDWEEGGAESSDSNSPPTQMGSIYSDENRNASAKDSSSSESA